MENWHNIVEQRLKSCKLPRNIRDEVVDELAAHLDETYEHARQSGMTDAAAVRLALQEIGDWRVLAGNICRAKYREDPMNYRSKTLWLPAMASTLGASLAMTALQWINLRHHHYLIGQVVMSFCWPWLATLPVIGALGAHLSRRAGGPVASRLLACLAPALWIFIMTALIEPILLWRVEISNLRYYCYGATNWVLIPGSLLLLGALPFLRETRHVRAESEL
jgi:hypothetical protein